MSYEHREEVTSLMGYWIRTAHTKDCPPMKPSKPEPEALTDQQRWQRIHDLALDRASAIVGKPGQEHAAKELVVMAGIAKDKLKPAFTLNYWLPEMDKRFCELRNELVAQLPWYRRWFCN